MIKDNQNMLNKFHIVIDAGLIVAAYFAAYPLRFYVLPKLFKLFVLAEGEKYLSFTEYSTNVIFLVPGYLLIYNMLGLYRPKRTHSLLRTLGSLFNANILGIFYFAFIIYIGKSENISRLFYGVFGMLNLMLGAAFRITLRGILKTIRRSGRNLKHVLIVGYSRTTEGFIDRVKANPNWGYKLHGILADSMAAGTKYKGVEVLAPIIELDEYIENNDFDEIVIALGIDKYDKLEKIVDVCEKSGVHTKFIPDYGNMISTVPYIEDLYGLPVINIRNVPLTNTVNIFVKRAFDIIGSLLALIVFAIPMIVIAVIIKCTSKGPIIFSQVRVGKHGREFKMFKFRSMYVEDPEEEKEGWTTRRDSRVTPIGRFIRKTSLDETPQLFNVLAGSMSLVGPRPERPQFVEKFREEIPRYMIKHQVRPGMTGWAQINGYRGDTSIKRRIEHDLYYIENWSIWLDIKILFLTVFKGFINKNAY
ncbi:MAG: undecaprenyl-phosphate glucose phosphotransferase [Lachnospiraceae bacterium]|nr:undecaprenyl-phosphate glucose phosphotransferase [Lachnospiraceae bacterium]